MKISFNPSNVAALTQPPKNKDITFDLRGHNIFARGVEFKGTDTNTWRSVTINGTSLGTKTLELKNGSNISITANGTISAINLASSSHTHPLVINGKSFSLGTASQNLGTYVPWTSNGFTLNVTTKSGNDIDTGGGLYIDANTGTQFYLWLHDTSNVWYKKTASGSWKKMDAGNADTWNGYSAQLTTENTSGTKLLVVDGSNVQYRTLSSILAGQNTWRTIQINGTSIGTNVLNLKNGSNIVLSNSNGQVTISANGLALSQHTHTFTSITSKPTTIQGYGITNAVYRKTLVYGQYNLLFTFTRGTEKGYLDFYISGAYNGGNFFRKCRLSWSYSTSTEKPLVAYSLENLGASCDVTITRTSGTSEYSIYLSLASTSLLGEIVIISYVAVDKIDVTPKKVESVPTATYGLTQPIIETLVSNSDKLDGVHLNGIFTAFSNNNSTISATIGGVTKSVSIPTSLKNPNKLSWSGYRTGSYDGSTVANFEIPSKVSQLTNDLNFISRVGAYTYSTNGTAPYKYIYLFRVANKKGYSTTNLEIDFRSRYHEAKLLIRITTQDVCYGEGKTSASFLKSIPYGRTGNFWVVSTVASSDYNYYDVYYESGAWNSGCYNIINQNNNSYLVFEHKGTNLDSLPSNAVQISSAYIDKNSIANLATLSLKDTSGNIKTFNAQSNVDLTSGVNYAANTDKLGGLTLVPGSNPFGHIPFISSNGVMEIGHYIDFHYDNTTGSDYSTRLYTSGNYLNSVGLPSKSGTLALISDIPTSLKNSNAIKFKNITGSVVSYDGSAAVDLTTGTYIAKLPYGFASWNSGVTWGNTTGTSFASWNDSTGGSIDFRRDNPSSGKMSIKVDGRVYVNEGTNPVISSAYENGFWGLRTPDGDNNWIRTPNSGIIPYISGDSTSGHSSLGTSSWYFASAYIQNIYGTLRGKADSASKADVATKLETARTISGGTDIRINYNFDGSSNPKVSLGFYSSYLTTGNKANYPFRRIAKLDTITSQYTDRTTTLYLTADYNGGQFGILRISLRTNSNTQDSSVEVKWLVRYGFSLDSIKIGFCKTPGATYADVFYTKASTYTGIIIRDISSGSRGSDTNTWTLVDSKEVNDTTTTDKLISKECYTSVENAATLIHNKPYTDIITSVDAGTVQFSNRIVDSNNERAINITYSKVTQSSTNYLASWNGYELGTISPSILSVGSATKLQTARTLWGNSFDGSSNISGTIKFNNVTSGLCEGIQWTCGDNNYARIKAGATASSTGYLEIATADGANEPIYVRQYSGVFSTISRTLTLLDALGNTTLPRSLFINTGDNTLKIYSGKITDGKSDGNICFQTSIDGTDGETHSYPTTYGTRCTICLQPRGGSVYIGGNPDGVTTDYKLTVNGVAHASLFHVNDGSHTGIKLGSTYLSSLNGSVIFQNNTDIRFGGDSWDQSQWAGLKYAPSSKIIYLGLADGSVFSATTAQKNGALNLVNIRDLQFNDYSVLQYNSDENTVTVGANLEWIFAGNDVDMDNYSIINANSVKADGFYHSTYNSDNYVLLAKGGAKKLSDLGSSHTHTFASITEKPSTLFGYGVTDGVNVVTVNGDGNAITSASISGHTITLTKNITFLTSQSLDNYYTKTETDSRYLKLSGGTMIGQINMEGNSKSWYNGRDAALVRISKLTGYSSLLSMKTTDGSWEMGAYNNSPYTNNLCFSYVTDADYNSKTNSARQILFNSDASIRASKFNSGSTSSTFVKGDGSLDSNTYISTSTISNYYWANVKISSTSSTSTYPTFGNMNINNTGLIQMNGGTVLQNNGSYLHLGYGNRNTLPTYIYGKEVQVKIGDSSELTVTQSYTRVTSLGIYGTPDANTSLFVNGHTKMLDLHLSGPNGEYYRQPLCMDVLYFVSYQLKTCIRGNSHYSCTWSNNVGTITTDLKGSTYHYFIVANNCVTGNSFITYIDYTTLKFAINLPGINMGHFQIIIYYIP